MAIRTKLWMSLVTTALMAASAVAATGVSLKFAPKAGAVYNYRIKAEFEVSGSSMVYTAVDTLKVVKVKATGDYLMEESQTKGKASINGQEMEAPPAPRTITTYRPNGSVVLIEGSAEAKGAYRLANISAFIYPDKKLSKGSQWSYEIQANSKTGAVAATASFSFVGEEKIGTHNAVKVKYSIKEKGPAAASNVGLMWIDRSTGVPLKNLARWINVPMPGSPAPISGTVTVISID